MTLKGAFLSALPDFLRPYWERLEASPLGYRLAKGAFWSLCGALISRVLGLAASVLVARMLGKEGFGELGIIQSTAGLFGVFAGFGLGLTATKHVAEFRKTDPARAGRVIAMSSAVAWATGLLAAAALFLLAPWLAAKTLAAPQLTDELRVSALLILLGAVNGAQTGALSGFEAFKTIAVVNLLTGLLNFPLLVIGTWWRGLEGAVWALAASLAANAVLNRLALRREARKAGVPLALGGWSGEWRMLLGFSLPAALSGAMVAPVYWVCSTILVNQPGGYAQMGVFNAANGWFNALMIVPGVISQAIFPALAERTSVGDARQASSILKHAILANFLVVGPLVVVAGALSPFIMSLYGPGFRSAWPVLVVTVLTAGLLAIQVPVGNMIAASGRMWLGAIMNAGWGAAFIAATALLVAWGALGLAGARGAAYILHAVWTLWFAAHVIKRARKGEEHVRV